MKDKELIKIFMMIIPCGIDRTRTGFSGALLMAMIRPTDCLPSVEEGTQVRSAGLPTCLPGVEEGWQIRTDVLSTCPPGVKEGSHMRR